MIVHIIRRVFNDIIRKLTFHTISIKRRKPPYIMEKAITVKLLNLFSLKRRNCLYIWTDTSTGFLANEYQYFLIRKRLILPLAFPLLLLYCFFPVPIHFLQSLTKGFLSDRLAVFSLIYYLLNQWEAMISLVKKWKTVALHEFAV